MASNGRAEIQHGHICWFVILSISALPLEVILLASLATWSKMSPTDFQKMASLILASTVTLTTTTTINLFLLLYNSKLSFHAEINFLHSQDLEDRGHTQGILMNSALGERGV